VTAPVQYGASVQAAAVSFNVRQMIPYARCAAHLLRELIYLKEQMDQPWAGEMIALLLEAKDLAQRERSRAEGSRRVISSGKSGGNRFARPVNEWIRVSAVPLRVCAQAGMCMSRLHGIRPEIEATRRLDRNARSAGAGDCW
jgi:hypothetical protein